MMQGVTHGGRLVQARPGHNPALVLRHTFGSFLIQDGASLAYVKDQMGHGSIQVTVDTYGHLIPGADIAWVDRLDVKTKPQQKCNTRATRGYE